MPQGLHPIPHPGLQRPADLAAALLILLVLLPVLSPIVWLLQTLQSPGPLFFTQHRVGLHGSLFRIFKFRSLPHAPGDPGFPFGHWLRTHGWDELPQCLNILRGDMSLVGPRPLIPGEENQIPTPLRHQRSSIRPGLTGLSQILGLRGNSPGTADRRLRTDLLYLRTRTRTLDLRILMRSLRILLPFTSPPAPEFSRPPAGSRLRLQPHPRSP